MIFKDKSRRWGSHIAVHRKRSGEKTSGINPRGVRKTFCRRAGMYFGNIKRNGVHQKLFIKKKCLYR